MLKLNKLTKGLFVLSALALVAGCDPIKMIPANYEDEIVDVNELQDNYMGVIYDAISSNIADKTHEDLLKMMGEKEYGTYEEIKGLKEILDDEDKLAEYADKHAHAFVKENDQKIVDNQKDGAGATLKSIKAKRVVAFYNDVQDRINESLYNEIKGGSYNDKDSKFHEIKFVMAKFADMYEIKFAEGSQAKLDDYKDEAKEAANWYIGYLDSNFKEENVREYLNNFDALEDYIKKSLIPSIYKDKMVEDYILANNSSNLDRAYGRKVEFVKITADSAKPFIAKNIATNFAELLKTPHAPTLRPMSDPDVTFESLADAWRGFKGVEYNKDLNKIKFKKLELDALDILAVLDDDGVEEDQDGYKVTVDFAELTDFSNNSPITVYRNTKVGEIFYNYNLAVKGNEHGRFATEEETTALNDFTANGDHSVAEGFRSKVIELATTGDYTTDDWFVKNGSIDLPEAIKTRLFNVNVAYALAGDTEKHPNASKYIENVKGESYLTGATSLDENYKYMIEDSGSYYFVKVSEAPSASRLDITREGSYLKSNGNYMLTEEIYRELANIITTKSSYTTKAYQAMFEMYALEFHDEDVYNYFASKYPDLYAEEDD